MEVTGKFIAGNSEARTAIRCLSLTRNLLDPVARLFLGRLNVSRADFYQLVAAHAHVNPFKSLCSLHFDPFPVQALHPLLEDIEIRCKSIFGQLCTERGYSASGSLSVDYKTHELYFMEDISLEKELELHLSVWEDLVTLCPELNGTWEGGTHMRRLVQLVNSNAYKELEQEGICAPFSKVDTRIHHMQEVSNEDVQTALKEMDNEENGFSGFLTVFEGHVELFQTMEHARLVVSGMRKMCNNIDLRLAAMFFDALSHAIGRSWLSNEWTREKLEGMGRPLMDLRSIPANRTIKHMIDNENNEVEFTLVAHCLVRPMSIVIGELIDLRWRPGHHGFFRFITSARRMLPDWALINLTGSESKESLLLNAMLNSNYDVRHFSYLLRAMVEGEDSLFKAHDLLSTLIDNANNNVHRPRSSKMISFLLDSCLIHFEDDASLAVSVVDVVFSVYEPPKENQSALPRYAFIQEALLSLSNALRACSPEFRREFESGVHGLVAKRDMKWTVEHVLVRQLLAVPLPDYRIQYPWLSDPSSLLSVMDVVGVFPDIPNAPPVHLPTILRAIEESAWLLPVEVHPLLALSYIRLPRTSQLVNGENAKEIVRTYHRLIMAHKHESEDDSEEKNVSDSKESVPDERDGDILFFTTMSDVMSSLATKWEGVEAQRAQSISDYLREEANALEGEKEENRRKREISEQRREEKKEEMTEETKEETAKENNDGEGNERNTVEEDGHRADTVEMEKREAENIQAITEGTILTVTGRRDGREKEETSEKKKEEKEETKRKWNRKEEGIQRNEMNRVVGKKSFKKKNKNKKRRDDENTPRSVSTNIL